MPGIVFFFTKNGTMSRIFNNGTLPGVGIRTGGTVFGDDGVGVAAAEAVDVLDGLGQSGHHLDGALEAAVFGFERLGRRRSERQRLRQGRSGVDFHLPFRSVDSLFHSFFEIPRSVTPWK